MNKFTVTIDGEDFTPKYFKFPDGQPHVEFRKFYKSIYGRAIIRGPLKSCDDIIFLIMLVEMLPWSVKEFHCTY